MATTTTTTDVRPLDDDVDRHRGLGRTDRQQVVAAQKARYGGISWGAAFFGWLSANGMAVILIALLSAAGLAFGLSDAVDPAGRGGRLGDVGIGLGAGIALLVALFLAYLAGGYVAGRMARFDGVKQGVAVWVIGLVVVVLLALAGLVFGSQYNVLAQLDLPRIPVDEGTATTAGHHRAGRRPGRHAGRRRPRRHARRPVPPQGRPGRLRRRLTCTVGLGVRAAPTRSAQQLGHPPVGQRLAAGLAGGAVLQRGVGEGDLADGVAADRAGQAGAGVHLQPGALLALEGGRPLTQLAVQRPGQRRPASPRAAGAAPRR